MSVSIYTEARWQRDAVAIWVLRDTPRGKEVLRLGRPDEIGVGWVEVKPERVDIDPTFELPNDALEALAEKAADLTPPSSAQGDHLADVVGVRDRLLTLVEELARPTKLAPAVLAGQVYPPDPPGRGGPTGTVD